MIILFQNKTLWCLFRFFLLLENYHFLEQLGYFSFRITRNEKLRIFMSVFMCVCVYMNVCTAPSKGEHVVSQCFSISESEEAVVFIVALATLKIMHVSGQFHWFDDCDRASNVLLFEVTCTWMTQCFLLKVNEWPSVLYVNKYKYNDEHLYADKVAWEISSMPFIEVCAAILFAALFKQKNRNNLRFMFLTTVGK